MRRTAGVTMQQWNMEFRLLSRYSTTSSTVFWIITEHDRSATTILLP